MTSGKVTPERRGTKAEQRAQTLERILDAAERLFSIHGIDAVTMKQVAAEVGVHTSLMSYYFEDKKSLFLALYERRLPISIKARMDALDRYEVACDGRPTVEGALQAFLETDIDLYLNGGEGWRNWGALGGQLSNTRAGAGLHRAFDPIVLRLVALLGRAMPDLDARDIFWGYQFVSGALLLSYSRNGRIDRLSDGLCHSDDLLAVKERISLFMTGGFRALHGGFARK